MRSYRQTFEADPRASAPGTWPPSPSPMAQWTEPYIFFTTGDPGITASTFHAGRRSRHGCRARPRCATSAMTMSAGVSAHGLALVLTHDLRVLAPGTAEGRRRGKLVGQGAQNRRELGIAALDDALADWRSDNSNVVRVSARRARSGSPGCSRIPSLTNSSGSSRWRRNPTSPRLVGPARRAGQRPCRHAALRRSLRATTGTPHRPAAGGAGGSQRAHRQPRLSCQPPGPDEIAEVRKLAASHDKMRCLLQDNQHRLARQEEELRHQIAALSAAEAEFGRARRSLCHPRERRRVHLREGSRRALPVRQTGVRDVWQVSDLAGVADFPTRASSMPIPPRRSAATTNACW